MNVSLVLTTRNEEETISDLLESIIRQTRSPSEIIIVDGGSTDKTIEIIQQYVHKIPIKLIISPKINISKGRNVAIKHATSKIIACTDGGCKLDKNWLNNIVKKIEENPVVSIVSGVYYPWYKNEFEEIASYLIFPNVKKLKLEEFLPSARSIAFKKEAWNKVGGFPEWLDTAEDTLFDINLRKSGLKFAISKDAIVFWRVREGNKKIFKQFFRYSKGDAIALLFPQRYIPRYVVATIIFLLATIVPQKVLFWFFIELLVFLGFWIKYLRKIRKPTISRLFTGLITAIIIEIGIVTGYLSGILTRIRNEVIKKY